MEDLPVVVQPYPVLKNESGEEEKVFASDLITLNWRYAIVDTVQRYADGSYDTQLIHLSTKKNEDGTEKPVIKEVFNVKDGWVIVQKADKENCKEIVARARACIGKKMIWRDSEHFAKTFAFHGESPDPETTDKWVAAWKARPKNVRLT